MHVPVVGLGVVARSKTGRAKAERGAKGKAAREKKHRRLRRQQSKAKKQERKTKTKTHPAGLLPPWPSSLERFMLNPMQSRC